MSDDLRDAFIVYLLSHNRPMGEVLSGRVKDLANEYRAGFEGMTEEVVAIEELIETQKEMIGMLIGAMPGCLLPPTGEKPCCHSLAATQSQQAQAGPAFGTG